MLSAWEIEKDALMLQRSRGAESISGLDPRRRAAAAGSGPRFEALGIASRPPPDDAAGRAAAIALSVERVSDGLRHPSGVPGRFSPYRENAKKVGGVRRACRATAAGLLRVPLQELARDLSCGGPERPGGGGGDAAERIKKVHTI